MPAILLLLVLLMLVALALVALARALVMLIVRAVPINPAGMWHHRIFWSMKSQPTQRARPRPPK
jgi:hypothetical protein